MIGKKYTVKKLFVFVATIIVIGTTMSALTVYFYRQNKKNILSHPKKYCYRNFGQAVNPAFILDYLIAKDGFVRYHEIISNDPMANPTFSFPITTLRKQLLYM